LARTLAILTMAFTGIATTYAGSVQLQIGSGPNGDLGLTAGTVTQTFTGGGGAGVFGEQGYVGDLPPGAASLTGVAGVPAPPAVPNGNVPGGQLLTSNGVTFAMIDDSANSTANMWISTNTAGSISTPVTTTDTIAIGIFGVSNLWTMLNDQYGPVGGTNTQVVFNFGTSASVANLPSLTFTLGYGKTISDAVDCLTGSCPTYATTLDTVNNYGPTGTLNPGSGATVSAFTVWEGTYATGSGAYNNTTGDVFLDAQNFALGSAYAGEYLVNVQIIDTNTATRQSRDVLSAITVAAAVPEPSTWLLFAAGIGALAFARLRRKAIV